MAIAKPTWLSILNPNKEPHETLVEKRLVLLEETTGVWKEWPSDTPAVAYDAEGDVVKYLPTPTGTTFEIELDQTFTSAATPTGKWWYGNFTTTNGFNHVFTAEQEGQLDDNNSFTFLYNEHNSTILIGMNNFGDGSFSINYENGNPAIGFGIYRKYYGNSNFPSWFYKITLPEPNVLAGDKVKITFSEYTK